MRTTQITKGVSTAFLALYIIWALTQIGIIGLLFTGSIGLITFGSTQSVEITTAVIILSGLVF